MSRFPAPTSEAHAAAQRDAIEMFRQQVCSEALEGIDLSAVPPHLKAATSPFASPALLSQYLMGAQQQPAVQQPLQPQWQQQGTPVFSTSRSHMRGLSFFSPQPVAAASHAAPFGAGMSFQQQQQLPGFMQTLEQQRALSSAAAAGSGLSSALTPHMQQYAQQR